MCRTYCLLSNYYFIYFRRETSVFRVFRSHNTVFFLSIDAIDTTETSQKLVFTTDTHVVVDVVVIIGRAVAKYRKIGHTKHDVFCEIRISSRRAVKRNECYRFSVTSVRLSDVCLKVLCRFTAAEFWCRTECQLLPGNAPNNRIQNQNANNIN